MSENKWEQGKTYCTEKGEKFIYIGTKRFTRQVYHLLHFVETGNYQYVHNIILNTPSRLYDFSKPHIAGVGYSVGTKEEPFSPHLYANSYKIWSAMISRCYLGSSGLRSYKEVEVDKEWHNFANFHSWYKKEMTDESTLRKYKLAIDKDLLGDGRKVYSRETCCFLPQSINSLLVGVNFGSYKKESARHVYHLGLEAEKYSEALSPRAKRRLRSLVQEYSQRYYDLLGFTLKEVFGENDKQEHGMLSQNVSEADNGVSIYGYLEYANSVYRFNNLSGLKALVKAIECAGKGEKVSSICKNNLMREGCLLDLALQG